MRVTVLHYRLPLGHADLTDFDPSMGCAMGIFVPTAEYKRIEHASVVDGEYLADRGQALSVFSEFFGAIECQGVAIQDFPALNEARVDVLGIPYPLYGTLFDNDPGYRAYRKLNVS